MLITNSDFLKSVIEIFSGASVVHANLFFLPSDMIEIRHGAPHYRLFCMHKEKEREREDMSDDSNRVVCMLPYPDPAK
jgi:hypothetical protein